MKLCRWCNVEKDISEFPELKRNQCRNCWNAGRRERASKKVLLIPCPFCKNPFKKRTRSKWCSIKCHLLDRIQKKEDCWEWMGSLTKVGYGKIQVKNKNYTTHRLSYEIFKGQIPDGNMICHSCDNKKCINPEHLWVGSAKDNMHDMIQKGRKVAKTGWKHTEETKQKFKLRPHSDRRGEKHHLSKLTSEDVLNIRKMIESGEKIIDIARKYNVDQSAISNIKRKRNWSHI